MTTEPSPAPPPSLFSSLGRLLRTFVGVLQTRLEILGTEVEEEKARLAGMLGMILGAAFCLGAGLMLVVAFVVIALWDDYRLTTLGVFAAAFLLGGAILAVAVKQSLASRPKPFAATIEELRKDRLRLTGKS